MRLKFCLIILSILFCIWLVGCASNTRAKGPSCPIEQLVLDNELFPPSSEEGELSSPLPDTSRHSAGRTIYMGEGLANHKVIYRSNIQNAHEEYSFQDTRVFGENSVIEWSKQPLITIRSDSATNINTGCGMNRSTNMCYMIAQYENYMTFFNIHIYEGRATLDTAEALMQEIDRRMSLCLAQSRN